MIKNKETYCTVYHKLVRELGAWEAIIYGTIANLLHKTNGIGEVSNQTLIELCGLPRASLARYISTLIKAGYIEKRAGDGRGNISIYYISQKGLNLSTLKQEKGSQFETERVSKTNIKGLNLSPINKGENKEINKESGGVTRDTREHTPLSTTTTKIFENMNDFISFWDLYPGDPEWSHEKENCERVWHGIQQSWRDNLVQQLQAGKRWRPIDNEHPERNNPIWYLRNYKGEVVIDELPFYKQGTATFAKWYHENMMAGVAMSVFRYEDRAVYCLTADKEKMIAAGAEWVRDNA